MVNQGYINDLLQSNNSDFAMIYSLEEKARKREKDLKDFIKVAKSEKDLMKVLSYCCDIIRYYSLIRMIRNDIIARLKEIEEIRNGSKQ